MRSNWKTLPFLHFNILFRRHLGDTHFWGERCLLQTWQIGSTIYGVFAYQYLSGRFSGNRRRKNDCNFDQNRPYFTDDRPINDRTVTVDFMLIPVKKFGSRFRILIWIGLDIDSMFWSTEKRCLNWVTRISYMALTDIRCRNWIGFLCHAISSTKNWRLNWVKPTSHMAFTKNQSKFDEYNFFF